MGRNIPPSIRFLRLYCFSFASLPEELEEDHMSESDQQPDGSHLIEEETDTKAGGLAPRETAESAGGKAEPRERPLKVRFSSY